MVALMVAYCIHIRSLALSKAASLEKCIANCKLTFSSFANNCNIVWTSGSGQCRKCANLWANISTHCTLKEFTLTFFDCRSTVSISKIFTSAEG